MQQSEALVEALQKRKKTDDAVYLLACPSRGVRYHAEQAVV